VCDNEHLLYLWKRHPCTSTVWRQLTDWRVQVTTWRDLRGLLYNHSDIVCLRINSTGLYWMATINKYFNMGCVTFRSPCTWPVTSPSSSSYKRTFQTSILLRPYSHGTTQKKLKGYASHQTVAWETPPM
jgi:hypothetical protein